MLHTTLSETAGIIAQATDWFLPLCFLSEQQKTSFGIWWRKIQTKDTHVSRQLGTHGKNNHPLERPCVYHLSRVMSCWLSGTQKAQQCLHVTLPGASILSHASTRDLLFSQAQPPKCTNDRLSVGKIAVAFSLYMNILGSFLGRLLPNEALRWEFYSLGLLLSS